MNSFSINKNTIALLIAGVIAIGFFVAGLFDVLDYFIVKALLFSSFAVLVLVALGYALKNEIKKNRPEDKLQDDSH